MVPEEVAAGTVDFGKCRVCGKPLDLEEYHLGLGRCKECARKCDEEVGFGTRYDNVADTVPKQDVPTK